MTEVYLLLGTGAVLPWVCLATELPFVRDWWLAKRARRATNEILARCPEARRATYEHSPARCAPGRCGRVMAPTTWRAAGEVAGARWEATR